MRCERLGLTKEQLNLEAALRQLETAVGRSNCESEDRDSYISDVIFIGGYLVPFQKNLYNFLI